MAVLRFSPFSPPRAPAQHPIARTFLAGSALGLVLFCAEGMREAAAQSSAPSSAQPSSGAAPVQLPPLTVEGGGSTDYQSAQPTLPKLTEPLRDTPQTIDAVPRQVLDDQGATTLRDALRNVPGLALAAGENSAQGDSFTIRGFTARNDIYLDGMNDFGSYYRDPFFLEDIQVLKGPASILFGRGSTGGVVEQDSKQPQLTPFADGTISFGTDMTKRLTADINQPVPELGQGAAFRLNLMGNDNNVAGRDNTEYSRFGLAPSLSLGLGTDTRINLSYLHQTEYDMPDYGVPWLREATAPGAGGSATATGVPAPVPENSFYGFSDSDYLRTNVDVPTLKVEHDFNDSVSIRDQLRYGHYQREFRITEPQLYIPGTSTSLLVAPGTPLGDLSVTRNELYGSSLETILQNQTDATLKFDTGPIGHTMVAGIELGRETSNPNRYSTLFGAPGSATPSSLTPLLTPDPGTPYNASTALSSRTTGLAFTQAAYALDTLKLNDQWQVMGGIRLDRFDANVGATSLTTSGAQSAAVGYNHVDMAASWRGALVYKPAPNGTIYFDAGTSFDPSIEALALSTSTIASTASLAPERTKSYELGTKWDVLHERLSLTGALFQSEQTNVREPDPNNPLYDILAGDAVAKGFELGVTGHLTDAWQVLAGYAYTFSEIEKSPVVGLASDLGHRLANVPMDTANLWTTYKLPWKLEIGGGIDYESSRYAATTPSQACSSTPCASANSVYFWNKVPGYWTLSAMTKYPLNEHVDLQLNLYNLTDNYYFDQLHPSHVVPGAGRTALLTVSFKY